MDIHVPSITTDSHSLNITIVRLATYFMYEQKYMCLMNLTVNSQNKVYMMEDWENSVHIFSSPGLMRGRSKTGFVEM